MSGRCSPAECSAPLVREQTDEREIAAGLKASRTALGALDRITAEGRVLDGEHVTLADCHLAPMLAYFVQAPEGADSLLPRTALTLWRTTTREWDSVQAIDLGLLSERAS